MELFIELLLLLLFALLSIRNVIVEKYKDKTSSQMTYLQGIHEKSRCPIFCESYLETIGETHRYIIIIGGRNKGKTLKRNLNFMRTNRDPVHTITFKLTIENTASLINRICEYKYLQIGEFKQECI